MSELTPTEAATLAIRVYDLQSSFLLGRFLSLEYFKNGEKSSPKAKHLSAEVGGRLINNHKDGFGVCAAGGANYANQLFLIFRGTTTANSKADFLTDARCGIKRSAAGLPVHCGFDHCFESMLPDIKKFFEKVPVGGQTVHCIGHSLGGAIASLAADWVARNTPHSPKLYTFGAPRVGTDWFVKSTTAALRSENMHRVYHKTDPVPMVALYPYMHAPYGAPSHYLDSSFPLITGEAHKMKNYIASVKTQSWQSMPDCQDKAYTIENSIEEWLKSKSPVDPGSSTFWKWVDAALVYVTKKVAMAAIYAIQWTVIGVSTVADKIAYILAKGINLAENTSIWIEHLMRKLMQALGMRVAKTKEELTESLMRLVLRRIMDKLYRQAKKAVEKLV